jgi:hypothetical protein
MNDARVPEAFLDPKILSFAKIWSDSLSSPEAGQSVHKAKGDWHHQTMGLARSHRIRDGGRPG